MTTKKMKGLIVLLVMTAVISLPVLGSVSRRQGVEMKPNEGQGSLKGALRALERRRRAPPGAYPLASFQDQNPSEFYLYREDVPSDAILNYLDRDANIIPDERMNYKNTAFRERNDQLAEQYKMARAKKNTSAFRERQLNKYKNEELEDLFLNHLAEKEEEEREESDEEYAEILRRLWEKYRYTHPNAFDDDDDDDDDNDDSEIDYKKRSIRKRQIPGDYMPSGGWGPIAFKRKRSSNQRLDNSDPPDFLYSLKFVSQSDPAAVENLKDDKVVDEEEDSDISTILNSKNPKFTGYDVSPSQPLELDEDAKLALQPLSYSPSDEMYLPDGGELIETPGSESLYPIRKRSNPATMQEMHKRRYAKRNLQNSNSKQFRSSFNDPKIVKDLSSIFGVQGSDLSKDVTIQKPVKRSSFPDDGSHESKSPIATQHQTNDTHESNNSHSHYVHPLQVDHVRPRQEFDGARPPMMTSSNTDFDRSHEGESKKSAEVEVEVEDTNETQAKLEHPIIVKKKSIDWSRYFGMDKRKKKSLDMLTPYLKAKRYMSSLGAQKEAENGFEEKRRSKQTENFKIDNMDNKLKNMERDIVDDALEVGSQDGIDTKEEQEIKEKMLSRLATAYSLEKMRKALKELKTTLIAQKDATLEPAVTDTSEDKEKRIVPDDDKKKKKSETDAKVDREVRYKLDPEDIKELEDSLFENEQGAGHFLNGPIESMPENYIGEHDLPNKALGFGGSDESSCPILNRIVKRCHSVDILAGDHGQLFLPMCSLHQICYLCGPSSPTGCDLMFLSEADSACGGRLNCQRAARGTLMALRDLHAPLAHHLQGECSRDNCLARPLRDNHPWHQPFRRR